jgi:hypothetical protein
VPLTTDDVSALIERHGIEFVVQPYAGRAFSDDQFARAGAEVREDLSRCKPVLGVKNIPVDPIRPSNVYLFFSQTTHGGRHVQARARRRHRQSRSTFTISNGTCGMPSAEPSSYTVTTWPRVSLTCAVSRTTVLTHPDENAC